jgi:Na+/melibiose symporter-like transporter
VFFINSLQQQITGNLTPYVTSAFSKHALLSTTSVMASIIGAVAKLPIAKIIDIWGRAEGYVLMVLLCTLGETCFYCVDQSNADPTRVGHDGRL